MRNARSPHVLPSLRLLGLLGAIWSGLSACDAPPAATPPPPDAGEAGVSACEDPDEDGFGPGCEAGFDCAPEDPEVGNECLGCRSPETGCPCEDGTEAIDCVLDPVEVGDVTMCYAGTRHCRDGVWSSCAALRSYTLPEAAPNASSGAAIESLVSGPEACPNPCDPLCRVSRDTPGPGDLTPGSGLIYTPTPGGITLEPDTTSATPTLPDTDGDGVPDAYDSAPTNPSITGHESGFFAVLPYGTTATRSRDIATTVRTVDVYFLVDTTGSMGGEIANLRTSLSGTIIPGIRAAIPDAWFGVGRHDDYPVSPYGGAAYGDRVFQHLQDITSNTTAAQNAVNGLATRWGNDLPESQSQALWAVATGGGIGTYLTASSGIGRNAGGTVVTSGIARTGCPTGRWGYPCFRDGTIPIVILLTDVGYHNGPHAPWNYASTAGGILAPGPALVVPAPFFPQPTPPTDISHRTVYPVPAPVDITHWEGWSPSSTAPIAHVTSYDAPATATPITHGSLLAIPTPAVERTHATGGSTAPLPASASRFAHVTTAVPTDAGRSVTHGTSATYSPTSTRPVTHATLTPSASGSSRSVTHRTSVTYPAPSVTGVTHGGATFPLGGVTPVDHAVTTPSTTVGGSAGGGYVSLPARASAVSLSRTATDGGDLVCAAGGAGCPAQLGNITGGAVSRRYTGVTNAGLLQNDHSVGCVSGSRLDAVFTFTLDREEVVRIRAYHYHRLVVGLYRSAVGPSLGIRYGCSQSPGSGFAPFRSSGAPAEITAALPDGTYYLVVEPMRRSTETGHVASNLDLDIQSAAISTFPDAYPGGDLSPPAGDRQLSVTGGDTLAFPNFRGSFGCCAPRTFGERTDLLTTPWSNYSGPDQYVSFSLTSRREVVITAQPTVGTYDIAFSVYNSSGGTLAAVDGPGAGIAESTVLTLNPGTYYVNIDGWSGSSGSWNLTVQPRSRRYDFPSDPYPAGDRTNLGASFSGSTVGLQNDDTSYSGPDAYYAFNITTPRTMRISLESGSAWDSALRLYNSGWGFVAGNDDRYDGSGRAGMNVSLSAGTYYVVVDGFGGSSGNYVLDLQPEPPRGGAGDLRTAPIELGNLSNTSWTGTGHTTDVGAEYIPSCLGSGPDGFYRFTIDGPRRVTARTTRSTGMTFDTVVSILDAAGTSRACNDDFLGSTLSSATASLEAGTYTVVVDGWSSTSTGNYRLDLEVTRPVVGDVESNAINAGDLTTQNVSYSASNTCDLNNDYDLSAAGCGGSTPGRDAVYRFTLSAARRITANVSNVGGGAPRFVIRQGSVFGTTMTSTGGTTCGTSAGTLAWDLPGAAPGTVYFLIVDTASACGGYTLSLDSSVNTVVGDTRSSPFEVPFPDLTNQDRTWTAGSTCDLVHNFTPSCAGGSTARDAFYAFTLFADRRVTLTLTNSSGLTNPVLAIVDASGVELGGPAACASGASSATITRDLTGSGAGTTYYAVVDSSGSANCGNYTLSYSASAVTRVGDTTAAPSGLGPLDSAGVSVTATGMCELRDDLVASCGSAGSGSGSRDAVYSFTLSAPRTLAVTLTGTAFTPAVTIRRAGAPTVELPTTAGPTCATTGTNQWAIDPGGVPTTYYLVIEGRGASCGTYSFSITSTGITSRTGDTFASPVPVGDLASSAFLYTAGSTCDLLDQFQSCGALSPAVPSGGRDAYYQFSLSAARDVTITLTPSPGFDATFHLLDASGVPYAASPTCANAGGAGSVESRTFPALPGGGATYYVVVDAGPGAPASCGNYTLGLRTNATSVEGDTYTNARNAGTIAPVSGAPTAVWFRAAGLCSINDDIASSCSTTGVGREDGVYRFRLDAPARVTVNVRDPAAPWTQASPAMAPTARNSFAIAYDIARGQVVLFGGNTSGTPSNETWLWDGTNWNRVTPATSPPARFGHAMAYDSSRGLVVMYGGTASDGSASFNDTWLWDGVNWTAASPSTVPVRRRDHAMAFDPNLNQILMFGGRINNTSPSLLETWIWDGANWQSRATVGPAARHLHAMTYDATSGFVMMFGGQGPSSLLSDTWVWNGTSWAARSPTTVPPARNAHAMAYDAIRRQVVLFGGFGSSTFLDDLWLWNGTNWVANTSAPRPSGRNSHAMAFDVLRSQVVVFGGGAGSPYTFRNDTWLWNGSAFDSVVSIRDGSFNEVPGVTGASCINAAGPGTGETITATLPIGTYYAIVDSADGSCGTYDIQIQPQTLGTVIGDTQSSAIALPNLTAASTSFRGTSTCDLADDYTSACSTAGPARRDAVYRFRIDSPRRVLATLTPRSAGFNAILELRDSAFALVSSCVDGAGAGPTGIETLSVASLPTGDYFLVIDSDDGSCGDYQIDVQTGSPTGLGDTYGTAIPSGGLDLTSMGASYMAGSTCDLAHDIAPASCGTAGVAGRDAVYQFTLTAPRIVTARLSGLSTGFDGVLSIRNLSGVEVAGACADVNGAGGNESLTVTLPGGTGGTTYYVVVDSDTPAGCGNYRVELSSAAVLGDTLATALTASLSSGAASVSGNTGTPAGLTNDALTPCSTGSGAGVDAFYRFQVPDARRVTLSARGTTWDLALGLRTATTILGCSATGVAGAVQTVVADLMPGIDYYVQIDGRVAGAAGAYQLDISTARVQGDTILTAIPAGNLTTASASFQAIGSGTMGLANDFPTCGATDGAGPDAFYAFSITAPRRITVTLTPATGYNASLAIRDGAGAIVTGTCTNASPAGVAETWTGILPSGDYTVQVDGVGTSAGRFQLDIASRSDSGDVRIDPVDAGNMTGRSASYAGTTVGLANDEVPSCGLAGSPDAYYSFFLTQPTFVQIDTFGSGTDTVLALYNATTSALLGCNDNTGAGTESSLAGSLAAGTYIVLLEHRSTAGAAYRLNFRTRTPDNERIATPFNVGNLTAASANVDGNTCQMASDFASVDRTCGTAGSGTGGDTVFTFTLDTTRSIVIDTVGSEFDTVLRLTNSAGGDIACDDNGGGGAGASRISQTLAAGTYYVILDAYGNNCGNYHLNIDVVGGTSSGFPTIPWGSAVSALNARDIDVIVVSSMGSYDTRSRTDADALCDATGTVRSVASCPTGQTLCFSGTGCCVGGVLRGSSTRFRYDINEDGSGLGSAVVEAVQNLSQYRRLDLTAVARDNPATVGFDERSFVSSITAVSFPAGRCTGISGGTRFLGCLPGTTVNFRANFIGAVMPTTVTQVFTFNIEVLGDDSIVLAVVPVTIVVPPIGPLYPSSATYTRDFDGDAGCPTGSTALPVWRDLRWTATLPAGTSIGWTVRSATTLAALGTAGPSTFTTPSEVSPVMLQARLMGSGQPTNARYLRVSATLNPSAAGDLAPTLTNMEVTWTCLPSE